MQRVFNEDAVFPTAQNYGVARKCCIVKALQAISFQKEQWLCFALGVCIDRIDAIATTRWYLEILREYCTHARTYGAVAAGRWQSRFKYSSRLHAGAFMHGRTYAFDSQTPVAASLDAAALHKPSATTVLPRQ